jgi:serine/threonine protein kinase
MQSAWPPTNYSGQLIAGRYFLYYSLGEGSFGEVYYAKDTKFEPPRPVALKLLHRSFLRDPQVCESLRREASTLARFSHPHILRVLDFEINRDQAYIVTELAANGSLAQLLKPDKTPVGKALPLEQVVYLLEQIATALDEAHGQGLIHRDIKPENILLDKANRVLLADFGLAMALNNPQATLNGVGSTGVWGTAEYAAPEIWDEKVGKKSDIYALGVLLFQMLTGQLPYQGTAASLMRQHMYAPIPRVGERAAWLRYPPALDEVFDRALSKVPSNRHASARELCQHFTHALQTPAKAYAPPPKYSFNTPNKPDISSYVSLKNEQTIKEGFKLLTLAFYLTNLLLTYRTRHKHNPLTYNKRGLAYMKLELYSLARKNFDKALELNPDYAQAYRNRGILYRVQGERDNSMRDLETAVKLGDSKARLELSNLQNPI